MIDFKNKDELPTTVAICVSAILILGAAGWILFGPKPQLPNTRQFQSNRDQMTKSIKSIRQEITSVNARLAKYVWAGSPEDINPIALKQVNGLVQARHLKLVGFHTAKATAAPNITLIPFVVSVEGSFPNVLAFTRDLEKPGSKFVVDQFEASNSDQSSDKVAANIGITAYQLPKPLDTVAPRLMTKGPKKNA